LNNMTTENAVVAKMGENGVTRNNDKRIVPIKSMHKRHNVIDQL
jgi:hypothetical protein